jgi:cell division septum initiation protein DivIVA
MMKLRRANMSSINLELIFDEESAGYSKAQVDSYIGNLAKAYQVAYEEYQLLQEKFDFLMNEYNKLEYQSSAQLNAKVISNAMRHVEDLARQIIQEKQWMDSILN